MLKADGYQPMLVNMRFIKPMDEEMLMKAAEKKKEKESAKKDAQ